MGLMKEFKEFAMKGNVVDMAVGVIIGGAFGGIVKSLVGDIVMPVVGALTKSGGSLGSQFLWPAEGPKPESLQAAKEAGGAYIGWGPFAQTTLDFLIVAFAIFMIIKLMNKAQSLVEGEKPVEEKAPKEIPEDIQLLREIRDSLAK